MPGSARRAAPAASGTQSGCAAPSRRARYRQPRRLDSRRVQFEKWHALGNDYLIVEAPAIPFELTKPRIRAICAAHTGVASDGILVLERGEAPGAAARLRIFNPDGSEAELSGNGAREAILYIHRRGWFDADEFSIHTVAGEIRARISSPTTCAVD